MGIESAQLDRAHAALRRIATLASELGRPTLSWFATYMAAGWELLRGDLAALERLTERALQLGKEARQPDALFVYAGQLIPVRHWQGRGEEVIGLLEEGARDYPRVATFRAGMANVYCWIDRRADAAVIIEQAAADGFQHVTWDQSRLSTLAVYADAAAHAGVPGAAAVLYELLEPWQDQVVWTGITAYGHTRMYLGMLAATLDRHEQADEHLSFACEFCDANDMNLWSARTHLYWAQDLAARREDASALKHASRALELAREQGYPALEVRAAAILETGSPISR